MEKTGRSVIVYINENTKEIKAYTSIKSLCKDIPVFKPNNVSHYLSFNKTNRYQVDEHIMYKIPLLTAAK